MGSVVLFDREPAGWDVRPDGARGGRGRALRGVLSLGLGCVLAACGGAESHDMVAPPPDVTFVRPTPSVVAEDPAGPQGTAGEGGIDGALGAMQAGTADALPCELEALLASRCWGCHGATPQAGAPMSLVSAGDLLLPARSAPERPVYALVAERVRSTSQPMPPDPTQALSTAELALIDGWIAGGTVPRDLAEGACPPPAATEPEPDPGAWHEDCENVYPMLAHGASDPNAGFHVTPDMNDASVCWYFDAPWGDADVQGLEFRSVIDKSAVVHHWLLYGTDQLSRPAGSVVVGCGASGSSSTLITGWAPGREDLVMPDDVGLQLPKGPGAGLVLQMHYYAGGNDVVDKSGVELCTTSRFREHTASISWLGTTAIALVPGASGAATGVCRPTTTEPIHVLRTWPHMHRLGRHMTATLHRAGGGSEPLVDMAFAFDFQTSYATPLTVMPGDRIETTCRYENDTAGFVTFGERTEDEMCFAFVYAYPANTLRSGSSRTHCIGAF